MCHQGIWGPYRYCEPVKCSWKYCVFYVFFFWCFTFLVVVKKHTANNLYTEIRQLFLGSFRYFLPNYDVVTASCVFFCVIGSFRVPSCWHTQRFCPNLVMPLGHQKERTFLVVDKNTQNTKRQKGRFHVAWNMEITLFEKKKNG